MAKEDSALGLHLWQHGEGVYLAMTALHYRHQVRSRLHLLALQLSRVDLSWRTCFLLHCYIWKTELSKLFVYLFIYLYFPFSVLIKPMSIVWGLSFPFLDAHLR